MTKTTEAATINIYADHVWAGRGILRDGIIEDCPAILGGSQDACEAIYSAIEERIAEDMDDYTVDGVLYTWSID